MILASSSGSAAAINGSPGPVWMTNAAFVPSTESIVLKLLIFATRTFSLISASLCVSTAQMVGRSGEAPQ